MKKIKDYLTPPEVLHIHKALRTSRETHPKEEYTSRWFHAIVNFLESKGYEIVSNELRDSEHQLLQSDTLSKEYFQALREVVNPHHLLGLEQRALLLISASPEDRARALNKVRGVRAN